MSFCRRRKATSAELRSFMIVSGWTEDLVLYTLKYSALQIKITGNVVSTIAEFYSRFVSNNQHPLFSFTTVFAPRVSKGERKKLKN